MQQIPEPEWIEINLNEKIEQVLKENNYNMDLIKIEEKPILKWPMIQNGVPRVEIIIEYNGEYNLYSEEVDNYGLLIRYLKELDFDKFVLQAHGKYGGAPRRKKISDNYIKTLFIYYPEIKSDTWIKEQEEKMKERNKAYNRAAQGLPTKKKVDKKKEEKIQDEMESGIDAITEEVEKNLGMEVEFELDPVLAEKIAKEAEKPCRNKNTGRGRKKKKVEEVKDGES